jgi:hypothetical protein
MTPLVLRAVSYNGRRLQCFVVRRERWGRRGCLAVEERRVFYFGGCVEVRRASCRGAEESALWPPAGVEQSLLKPLQLKP